MIEVFIDNSYSQIKGITSEQFKALRELLSYQDNPQASYYQAFVRPKYLIDKHGNFPTGLLKLVKGYLDLYPDLPLRVTDKRVQPRLRPPATFKGPTPYPWQSRAVEIAAQKHRGGIVATTGTGKSLVIALLAAKLNIKTLVVVPSLEIKKQLSESLKANKLVRVENIDSKALEALTGYDCLIIDETHHAAAAGYQKLNKTAWKGIYYRFFLTATYFRNQQNEQLLFEGIAGQVIYELTYKKAVENQYIVPVDAYYYKMPKVQTDAYTYREVYNELVVNNVYRNETISLLLLKLEAAKIPTLCLVREIAHGNILSEMTGIPFANGQDEDTRKYIDQFKSGKIKTLIGTTGVLAEGVDTKPCEYVIIAGLGKAKSNFMQSVGRAVRTYPGKDAAKVVIFEDPSHKFTKSHFKAQVKYLLDEYGIKPVLLTNE